VAVKRPALGQHFLRSEGILERIADALPITPGRLVIEIGPGRGALTEKLLDRGAKIVAVEVDPGLAAGLEQRFSGRLRVVARDILKVELAELVEAFGARPLVAGNLPYYITSPIVRRVFGWNKEVEAAVFLVQKEVGERITARPGSSDYRFLSALCEYYSEAEYLFDVSPGAFQPPPRVQSGVVRLTMRPEVEEPQEFVKFLEAAFRQPRKTLTNNLGPTYGREKVAADPDARKRAQELNVEQLHALWTRVGASSASATRVPNCV